MNNSLKINRYDRNNYMSQFYGPAAFLYPGKLNVSASDESLNIFSGETNSPFTISYFRYHNNDAELNGHGSITISELDEPGNWQKGVLLNVEEWWANCDGTPCNKIAYRGPTDWVHGNSIRRPAPRTWTHITVTYDEKLEKVFINGTFFQQKQHSLAMKAAKAYDEVKLHCATNFLIKPICIKALTML